MRESKILQATEELIKEAKKSISEINPVEIESFIQHILTAKNIFLIGVGQTGLMCRSFAMRLMHLGFNVFFVGDVTTPGIKSGDLLIAVSNSGETATILVLAEQAKRYKAKIIVITSKPNSRLAKLADSVIIISTPTETDKFHALSLLGEKKHGQMSGTFFTVTLLLFFHGLVCELIPRLGRTPEQIDERHANLQ